MGNRKQQHNTTKSYKINKSAVSWPPAGTTIIYDNLISPIPCTSLYDQTGAADMFDGNVMSGSKHLWAASLRLVAADSPKLPMTSWLIGIVKSVPSLRLQTQGQIKALTAKERSCYWKGDLSDGCFCECRFLGVLHGLSWTIGFEHFWTACKAHAAAARWTKASKLVALASCRICLLLKMRLWDCQFKGAGEARSKARWHGMRCTMNLKWCLDATCGTCNGSIFCSLSAVVAAGCRLECCAWIQVLDDEPWRLRHFLKNAFRMLFACDNLESSDYSSLHPLLLLPAYNESYLLLWIKSGFHGTELVATLVSKGTMQRQRDRWFPASRSKEFGSDAIQLNHGVSACFVHHFAREIEI